MYGAYDIHLDWGLSAYDIRKNFTANFTYELPFGRQLTGLAGQMVKGWQVNGVAILSDGFPVSLFGSPRGQSERIGENPRADLAPGGNSNPVLGGPDQYYDPSQFEPSKLGYYGTVGRNTLITPGLATFDLGLFKRFSLPGNQRSLQFRAEFFNLFNRTNFGTPVTTVFQTGQAVGEAVPNPEAGRINSTRTSARQIQLGLRLVF